MSKYLEIQELISYVQGPPESDDGGRIRLNAAPPPRRVATTVLLDWLLDRAEGADRVPLELSVGASWVGALRDLINSSATLDNLFITTENDVDFLPEVHEDQQREIEEFVAEHYSPPFFDT